MRLRFFTLEPWGYAFFRLAAGGLIVLFGQLFLLFLIPSGVDMTTLVTPIALMFAVISYPTLKLLRLFGADSLPPTPVMVVCNTVVWCALIFMVSLIHALRRKQRAAGR
jgi:hypothetical protein